MGWLGNELRKAGLAHSPWEACGPQELYGVTPIKGASDREPTTSVYRSRRHQRRVGFTPQKAKRFNFRTAGWPITIFAKRWITPVLTS